MKWTLRENQVAEQGNVCDACKMQIENHKTTRTPAWRAAGGTVCALLGTVEYLLQGFCQCCWHLQWVPDSQVKTLTTSSRR